MAAPFSLFLAACLCGPLRPPAGAPDTHLPQVSVEERYDALAHEFASIRQSLAEAKVTAPAESEPRWLRLAFRAQMAELADAGSPRALAWLVAHFAVEPAKEKEAAAIEGELYERLLPHFAGEAWLGEHELDVVTALAQDAPALGFERAAEWEHSIYLATPSADLRTRALLAEARILAPADCSERERKGRAIGLLHGELLRRPAAPLAQLYRDTIWRIENLTPGSAAPDFTARDVDGNELHLSDWGGRVVLVDVWTFARTECSARLASRQSLADRHQNGAFVLLGVALDRDELAFRRNWESFDLRFPCAFEGGVHGRVQNAWHLDGTPKNILIDRGGIIRAVDLDGDALEAAVAALLAEPATDATALGPPHQRR